MHWWTWVIMAAVVLAGLATLAVVALGTTRRLPAMRAAQADLQATLQGGGAVLSERAQDLIVDPLELLKLRAGRASEQLALLKAKRGSKSDGEV